MASEPSAAAEVLLVYKGRTEKVAVELASASSDALFEAARHAFDLQDFSLKIVAKGKQITQGSPLTSFPSVAPGVKCMVMATGKREAAAVMEAKSDPTVRGFASEDALARHHSAQQQNGRAEDSEWGTTQDATHRFCRFEPCTWQSFGTRPSSTTPHAFEARALMIKLAHDPAIIQIMKQREWTVGLLAELDPIDDSHAEKVEGEGKRLLGYNTNAGASIHIRLRSEDLKGFLPYPALIDTLLHELAHNVVGPHNAHFWHLFCQLKADYLRALLGMSRRGDLFNGKSALQLACAAAEAQDVRSAVLGALERDSQAPASAHQIQMLDGYLAASGVMAAMEGTGSARRVGGDAGAGGVPVAATAEERRELLAMRASARMAAASAETARADPQATAQAGAAVVALKVHDGAAGELGAAGGERTGQGEQAMAVDSTPGDSKPLADVTDVCDP